MCVTNTNFITNIRYWLIRKLVKDREMVMVNVEVHVDEDKQTGILIPSGWSALVIGKVSLEETPKYVVTPYIETNEEVKE